MNLAQQLAALRDERARLFHNMSRILSRAIAGNRDMTADEQRQYDQLGEEVEAKDQQMRALEESPEAREAQRDLRLLPGYDPARHQPTGAVVLTREQHLADRVERPQQSLSVGRWLKGTLTGDWHGADEERAMSIGTSTAGGHLVPTPLAADVIDLARNQARVLQAGALTVPMDASTLKLARVTGDPAAQWHAENAPINATDMTLDAVTFTAQTLTALVKFSRELFEDAENLDRVVRHSLAAALALELDRVALYGSGTAPEPKGLINATGLAKVSMGTNGLALANYDPFIDAVLNVENGNHAPNAMILAPRTNASLSKLKDTTNQPLNPPAAVAALARLVTKQVPVNRTQGTATNASDVFVGQWDQLMIGMRMELGIQLLTERFSDNGQYAALAWMRADVQLAHVEGFAAIVGIIP